MWQTLSCFTTACGPFHWVSDKAVGIMDTSLCEARCMNNGLFVRLPVSAVHVFHNQAWTITVWLSAHSMCFAVNCDVFFHFDIWVRAQVLAKCSMLLAGWSVFWFGLVRQLLGERCKDKFGENFATSPQARYYKPLVFPLCHSSLSIIRLPSSLRPDLSLTL